MSLGTMPVRFSSSVFLAAVMCSFAAACGENFITIQPSDAGLGSAGRGRGSNLSSSGGADDGGAPSGGRRQSDAGAADASDVGVSCARDADCNDHDACTGTETCVSGLCRAGVTLGCNDSNPCTTDACVPATGGCRFTPVGNGLPCADENRCDGQTCNDGICTAGPPLVCADDGDACTTQTCIPATGVCITANVATGGGCSDGNACNGSETCLSGVCQPGVAPNCNDNNPCTIEACDLLSGCISLTAPDGTACPDGNVCNGTERCTAGACQPAAAPLACPDDGNPCTTAACNPSTGVCLTTNLNATPSPDGDLCDGQVCSNGVRTAGTPVSCPDDGDNNVCTANTCAPATGLCTQGNSPHPTSCADGDFCDGAELCFNGACFPGPAPCDDANPCTVDTCTEATDVCSNSAVGSCQP